MSTNIKPLLTKGLQLYYKILKLHRRALPPQMKVLGDYYVRQ